MCVITVLPFIEKVQRRGKAKAAMTVFKKISTLSFTSVCYSLFFVFCVIRLLGALYIPLLDPSEARYGEIARKMVETHDWITLYHQYGVPFWGKPPLSTWVSAVGIAFSGVNAFAARFPIFLVSMGIIWFIAQLARTRQQKKLPEISALVLLTGVLFYIASAAVMTDMVLTFGTTLSMVAFWYAIKEKQAYVWKYLFFVGQAIGFLGKGPIALVITGLPLLLWSLWNMTFKELWKALPWVSGILLFFFIAAPWYILAELKTPGFLNYYLIGEHFGRYFIKGWSGDLYGYAHVEPKGFIWVFWLLCIFPWSIWFIGILAIHIRQWRTFFASEDGWVFYLLLWTLSPLLIFTPAQHIIWTYPLPGIPAFSLLLGHFLTKYMSHIKWVRPAFFISSFISPFVMLVIIIYSQLFPYGLNSQKNVLELFMKTHVAANTKLIYYCHNCYSAEFYSQGTLALVRDMNQFQQMLESNGDVFVVMRKNKIDILPQHLRERLLIVEKFGKTTLYKVVKKSAL